jgi:hypothetical protein
MAKCYFELRAQSARGTDSIAADIMRHFYARQHLGKAVIICSQPAGLLAASRRQWLKMSRALQKQRSSTLNADKILKYTHAITQMQHVHFSSKTPLEEPEADIYFLDETQCDTMPVRCYSVYTSLAVHRPVAKEIIGQLPSEALVIDYHRNIPWAQLGLQSKVVLEQQVSIAWKQIRQFLSSKNIDISALTQGNMHNIDAMDDALDTLLDVSQQFLRVANEFHHALGLARPLRVNRAVRQDHDSLMLLAYRVQALSPGIFTQHFLETYNEDDTFFLYDYHKRHLVGSSESLADAVKRHITAGRPNLARALRLVFASHY